MTGAIYTFYSYKGGVGRSFVLANPAVILSQWGFHVLAVDWDIEAPGLIHYFEKFMSGAPSGVLDFLTDCRLGSVKNWESHVLLVDLPDCKGKLSLMPAAATNSSEGYTETIQT